MPSSTARFERLIGSVTLLAACGVAAWAAVAQPPAERTVRDGVFSAAQIARGKHEFEAICVECHEIDELTGPGAYFEEAQGKTVWDLLEYIWAEMPEDDPASLDPKDYAAILAYALSVYGLPSGEADLPVDRKSLETIRITGPERPSK